jgi:acyl-[acyl-carrier-protein]-phospholipid O-acyltransferase/long-chain-fatty-acid--[acyl-carrier-protein] ligase
LPVACGETGLLLVKGPSVMQGYLHQPEKTAAVIRDGWYNTGDIARVDKDGFLYLTDRLTRFSKIGGEMVPHGALEEVIQSLRSDPCVAVVSSHDAAKGERLVVCYTEKAGEPAMLRKLLVEHGLPNLWVPSLKNFVMISDIPVLGSGKVDLQAVKSHVQHALVA